MVERLEENEPADASTSDAYEPGDDGYVCQCRNGHQALLFSLRNLGPLASPQKAFTYAGKLDANGDVPWGIYRWYVNGQFVYDDPGWDLILTTMTPNPPNPRRLKAQEKERLRQQKRSQRRKP